VWQKIKTIRNDDAVASQLLAQLTPATVLFSHQILCEPANALKLFKRGQAVIAPLGQFLTDLANQSSNTNHEKLIKVVTGNRQEPKSLKERMCHVPSFFEDAHIET
jgi:hypothetical protein